MKAPAMAKPKATRSRRPERSPRPRHNAWADWLTALAETPAPALALTPQPRESETDWAAAPSVELNSEASAELPLLEKASASSTPDFAENDVTPAPANPEAPEASPEIAYPNWLKLPEEFAAEVTETGTSTDVTTAPATTESKAMPAGESVAPETAPTSDMNLPPWLLTAPATVEAIDQSGSSMGAFGQSATRINQRNASQDPKLMLQRKAVDKQAKQPEMLSDVHEVLRSPSSTLDSSTKRVMESRFGYNFDQVQIYDGSINPKASASASALEALAYTVGHHIVFKAGHYAPQTRQGTRLIAHELTHVIQNGGRFSEDFTQNTNTTNSLEAQANHAAFQVGNGLPVHIQPATAPVGLLKQQAVDLVGSSSEDYSGTAGVYYHVDAEKLAKRFKVRPWYLGGRFFIRYTTQDRELTKQELHTLRGRLEWEQNLAKYVDPNGMFVVLPTLLRIRTEEEIHEVIGEQWILMPTDPDKRKAALNLAIHNRDLDNYEAPLIESAMGFGLKGALSKASRIKRTPKITPPDGPSSPQSPAPAQRTKNEQQPDPPTQASRLNKPHPIENRSPRINTRRSVTKSIWNRPSPKQREANAQLMKKASGAEETFVGSNPFPTKVQPSPSKPKKPTLVASNDSDSQNPSLTPSQNQAPSSSTGNRRSAESIRNSGGPSRSPNPSGEGPTRSPDPPRVVNDHLNNFNGWTIESLGYVRNENSQGQPVQQHIVVVTDPSGEAMLFYRRSGSGTNNRRGAQEGDWAPYEGHFERDVLDYSAGYIYKTENTHRISEFDHLYKYGSLENARIADWIRRRVEIPENDELRGHPLGTQQLSNQERPFQDINSEAQVRGVFQEPPNMGTMVDGATRLNADDFRFHRMLDTEFRFNHINQRFIDLSSVWSSFSRMSHEAGISIPAQVTLLTGNTQTLDGASLEFYNELRTSGFLYLRLNNSDYLTLSYADFLSLRETAVYVYHRSADGYTDFHSGN